MTDLETIQAARASAKQWRTHDGAATTMLWKEVQALCDIAEKALRKAAALEELLNAVSGGR